MLFRSVRIPAAMRTAVEHAVAHDFAVGMQAVLWAMAGALAIAFVIALRHPGDRPATALPPEESPTVDRTGDCQAEPALGS